MKSRKERRAEARKNKTTFEPQYNGRVITKAEFDEEVKAHKAEQKELLEKYLKEINSK
jgi:hypothetical protein